MPSRGVSSANDKLRSTQSWDSHADASAARPATRGAQGPCDDLDWAAVSKAVFPSGSGRMSRLPLFWVKSDASSDKTFQLEPLGRFSRTLFAMGPSDVSKLPLRDGFRHAMALYLAKSDDGWAQQVRRTMVAMCRLAQSSPADCTAAHEDFLSQLARLDPVPADHAADDKEETRLRAAVQYIADQLIRVPDPRSRSLRWLLLGNAKAIAKEFRKHTFSFLLPDKSLTELELWFGWTPIRRGYLRIHPLVWWTCARRAYEACVNNHPYFITSFWLELRRYCHIPNKNLINPYDSPLLRAVMSNLERSSAEATSG
jgi:hypothetical protein